MKTCIVNYGIGNILSVRRALEYAGTDVICTNCPKEIEKADRIVVPGVGAFQKCMDGLAQFNLKEALLGFANTGKPYLGICVGMQMLLEKNYEFGEHQGLGIVKGEVRKIEVPGERVPFIGWKSIDIFDQQGSFYFVHSYQAFPLDPSNVIAAYRLGSASIVAAIRKDNVLGVQFHPEKSAKSGLDLIKAFLKF